MISQNDGDVFYIKCGSTTKTIFGEIDTRRCCSGSNERQIVDGNYVHYSAAAAGPERMPYNKNNNNNDGGDDDNAPQVYTIIQV